MQSRCVWIKPWVLWSHPAWSRSLVETPPGVPSSLKDAALPSSSCFQSTENSQVLPDPRSNSQEVQGCSTGVHKQPWPHPLLPFSFSQIHVLLFYYPDILQNYQPTMLILSEQVTQEMSVSMWRVYRWARHWSHNCRIRDEAFEQLSEPGNHHVLPPEIPRDT